MPRQIAIVWECIGLNESRGIGRIPGSLNLLPLPRRGCHDLKVIREVFRQDGFHVRHDHLAPRRVCLLHDPSLVWIDATESSEWLVRTIRIEAVDVDFGVAIFE